MSSNTKRLNRYDTLLQALKALRRKGFVTDFTYSKNGFKNPETGKLYQSRDMRILEYHRFEGMTNPADSSVVFAVACFDGTKGIFISSYGTYSDPELMNQLQQIKIADSARDAVNN